MGVGRRLDEWAGGLPRLNTLFVRYGCGTGLVGAGRAGHDVLIPYSSGMGVGPHDVDLSVERAPS